ncbi:MAG: DUF3048 domain-containing protein [Firmicutes bacterium]|nr:DUF3048 domain-containing protein [Bacillota bacterium]
MSDPEREPIPEQELEKTIVRPLRVKRVSFAWPEPAPRPRPKQQPSASRTRPGWVPLRRVVAGLAAALLLLSLGLLGFKLGSILPAPGGREPAAEDPLLHPLTGAVLPAETESRLLCAVVDNSPEARPQSGLEQAALIYELPVEADIPRLLLCYYGEDAPAVGPIRSARPYLVDIVRGWGGVLAHCGWSPAAQSLLEQGAADYINEQEQPSYFRRDPGREAPHNLYTSTAELYQAVDELGLAAAQTLPAFRFRDPADEPAGTPAHRLELEFNGAETSYIYDGNRRAYARFVNDDRFTDAASGSQIFAANIILQYVDARVTDEEGRLELDLSSGGEALLFSGGTLTRGRWTRTGPDAPIRYTDASGEDFALLPGQTWIEVCGGDIPVSF